jgi:hypothetical protein
VTKTRFRTHGYVARRSKLALPLPSAPAPTPALQPHEAEPRWKAVVRTLRSRQTAELGLECTAVAALGWLLYGLAALGLRF